jgi:Tfp pilus assembly protein FimT
MELIVVLALLGILTAISLPNYMSWRASARYNEAAQEIAAAFRNARSQALTSNRQHRITFDLINNRYRLSRGDRTSNSTAFVTIGPVWTELQRDFTLRGRPDCSETTALTLDFLANGTATLDNVCVMTAGPDVSGRYRVGIQSATTGRVAVTRF